MIENNRALSVARVANRGFSGRAIMAPEDRAGERRAAQRCGDAIRRSLRCARTSTAGVDNFVGNRAQRVAKP
jgi:hypothetical protein